MMLTQEQTRATQLVALGIFKEFAAVCEKLNVKYYVCAGTLLGAVRHQGFIPWDDDIDVAMPRKDFDYFVKHAPEYLPNHLFTQTHQTDPGYIHVYAKLRNSNTAFIETAISHRDMNHGLFIDIFPLDYYDESMENKSIKLRKALIELRLSYCYKKEGYDRKVRLIRPLSKLIYPTVRRAIREKDRLNRLVKSSGRWANYASIYGLREVMPVEWYGEGVELDFEDIKVVAPVEYHKYLSQLYGDYMQPPPEEKRVSHHLAVAIDPYKSYLEYLKNK